MLWRLLLYQTLRSRLGKSLRFTKSIPSVRSHDVRPASGQSHRTTNAFTLRHLNVHTALPVRSPSAGERTHHAT
jgi:hypothetical protein